MVQRPHNQSFGGYATGVLIVPPPSVSYDLERDAIARAAIFGFFRAALATTGRRLDATPQGTLVQQVRL